MHKIKKISSTVLYVLLGISLLTFLGLMLFYNDSPDPMLHNELGLNIILIWAAVLLGLAIVITIVMAAFNVEKNPKGSRTALMGLGILAVVLVVTYFVSSTEPITLPDRTVVSSNGTLLFTDMGLYTAYFALVAAIVAVIVGEVRNSLK